MDQVCDECATALIILEQYLVCPSCGLVHDQACQVRTPLPGFKQRLGSLIARTNAPAHQGMRHNEALHAKYRKLGDLQESIYRGYYLDLFRLTSDLQKIVEDLLLPGAVVESTMNLFHEITSKVRNPYNNYALLLAICFIKVTREMGNAAPVKIIEVADAFEERGYKFSPRVLAKTLYYASNIMPVKKFRSCEEYVGKVLRKLEGSVFLRVRADAIELNMDDYLSELEHLSRDLLVNVPPVKRGGKNPFLLAASSVYASSTRLSKERGIENLFTKTEFSKEVGIAEYTLRSHLSEIFNKEVAKKASPPILCR